MKRLLIMLALMVLISACGGSETADPTVEPTTASVPTSAADDSQTNSQPTPAAPNMAFADALTLDGEIATTITPEMRSLFYRFNVANGSVVDLNLAVEAGSAGPLSLDLYNEQQVYITNLSIPVGETQTLRYIFDATQGGTMFASVSGTGDFRLSADISAQNDGNSAADAPTADDYTKALLVTPGEYTGILGDADRSDLYTFDMPKSGARLSLDAETSVGEVDFQLFSNDQNYMANGAVNPAEPLSLSQFTGLDDGGRWYIRVQGDGEYSWKLELTEQNDANSNSDAADQPEQATKVEFGDISGEVGDLDDTDMYRLNIPADGGIFNLTLETEGESIDLQLFNNDQGYEDEATALAGESIQVSRLLSNENKGNWTIRIRGEGAYTINTTWEAQNDANSGSDAGIDVETATIVDAGAFEGQVGDRDSRDMYRLPSVAGRRLKITILEGQGILDVQLFDSNQGYGENANVVSGEDSITVTMDQEGVYYLRLDGDRIRYGVEVLK